MPLFSISVVILNYNGKQWLARCIDSLGRQTISEQLQVIVADNASSDGSDQLARDLLLPMGERGVFVQNGGNFGYCQGNNLGAQRAEGEFLLFLNNDTWLEPNCLERLLAGVQQSGAQAGGPRVVDYDANSFQTQGAEGFDFFGYFTSREGGIPSGPLFVAPGCAFLVNREMFARLRGFDSEFFMYSDETDFGWRMAIAGFYCVTVADAIVHHRGAVASNPKGGDKVVEYRTNVRVRYYATRNSLLLILKNAHTFLLFLVIPQLLWVMLEMVAVLVITRNFDLLRRSYLRALGDIWRMRSHVCQERSRIRILRRHGDFWMLRYFRLRLGRWPEIKRMFNYGPPKMAV